LWRKMKKINKEEKFMSLMNWFEDDLEEKVG
jgi:hypothetical protein